MRSRETPLKRTSSQSLDLPADTEARLAMLTEMQERVQRPKKGARRGQPTKRSAARRAPVQTAADAETAVRPKGVLTKADVEVLLTSRAEHRISLYMPLHAPGANGAKNPTRLKNLLRRAEESLVEKGVRPADAREMLKPPAALVVDQAFWQQREGGLGILLTQDMFHCFHLPSPPEESATVGQRFRIRPLLPLLPEDTRFWLLAVSANKVRLFRGDRQRLDPVTVAGLPNNLSDALNLDVGKSGGQTHSAMSYSQTSAPLGKQGAVFTGQGDKSDMRKEDIKLYCRAIDAAVYDTLMAEPAPLLVACVEYLFPIYAEVNRYARLLERPLNGNVEHLMLHELHEQAWPLVEPSLHEPRREAAERYDRLVGAGKASPRVAEILPAAAEGRVDTLFIARHAEEWGTFDAETLTVETHAAKQPKDDDLLDVAAAETLLHSGAVYPVAAEEVPGGGAVAAVFRY